MQFASNLSLSNKALRDPLLMYSIMIHALELIELSCFFDALIPKEDLRELEESKMDTDEDDDNETDIDDVLCSEGSLYIT